jgi:bacterioferritin
MGTKGREIVGVDVKELLKMLNKAYADEWLAYYQYWVGAKVATGRMRGFVAGELMEHANEELSHADKLAERITQLGGSPLLAPEDLLRESGCGYDSPRDSDTRKLLEQNIKGEQCAIATYKRILDFVRGKDDITAHLVLEILEDEVEHEEDLEAIAADMKTPAR